MSTDAESRIRIAAIVGTVRPGNYTGKALRLAAAEAASREGVVVDIVDPSDLVLPFPGHDDTTGDAKRLQDIVSQATGIILSTPEYHGGFSSVIKLVIENLAFPSAMAGKPVALLGVAAGQIGAIKSLESLRGICSHVGAIVLPGPVSVAGVQKVFDDEGNCLDEGVDKRVRGLARNLLDYIDTNICPRFALEAMVRSES